MKETGVLMKPELALATREGRKTMTRRLMAPQPANGCRYEINGNGTHALHVSGEGPGLLCVPVKATSADYRLPCPYGVPGDRLYVKEPFRINSIVGQLTAFVEYKPSPQFPAGLIRPVLMTEREIALARAWKKPNEWKSSFFMFKSLARTWMEITAVRAERIQDISDEDIIAEGIGLPLGQELLHGYVTPTWNRDREFIPKWDKINKPRGNGWDENKWQWVITYKLIENK